MNEQLPTTDSVHHHTAQGASWGLEPNLYQKEEASPLFINDVMAFLFRSENVEVIRGGWDVKSLRDPQPYTFLRVRADLINMMQVLTALTQISMITAAHGVRCEYKQIDGDKGPEIHFLLVRIPASRGLPAGPTEKVTL